MAVLTPAACVIAMAALIATVPKTGRVHQQRRVIRDEVALKTHLWDEAERRICGWMISPSPATTTVSERHPGHHGKGVKGGGNVLTTFQFQIEGYLGLDDANLSEATWRDLAWDVANEFNAYGLLNIDGVVHQLPCDVEQFGYAAFAGFALLHYARLTVGFQGRTRPAP
jgi:hypothetical protein